MAQSTLVSEQFLIGEFFLDEAVTVEFYANHSVHSSSGSLLIQAGRVWLSTDAGRNDLSLSGEAEGEDIFFSSSSYISQFTHTRKRTWDMPV